MEFFVFLSFIFGITLGSFLGVLIDRLPRGEDVVSKPSHCESCGHKLKFYDLFPVISWITLNGKCRYCKTRLSPFYPFIELLTGTLFALITFSISSSVPIDIPKILFYLFIASVLIVVFFADWKYGIIPDVVLVPGIVVTIFWILGTSSGPYPIEPFISALMGMVGLLMIVFFTKGRGMGLGDVKFAVLMGLLAGYPRILVAFYIAFLTGALAGVILLLTGRKKLKQTIAFGPFLVIGLVCAMTIGDTVIGFLIPYFK